MRSALEKTTRGIFMGVGILAASEAAYQGALHATKAAQASESKYKKSDVVIIEQPRIKIKTLRGAQE